MELARYAKLVRQLVLLGRNFNVAVRDVSNAFGLNEEKLVAMAKLAHIDEAVMKDSK